MNVPNEFAYPIIAIAWAISFCLMIYLIKLKLPRTATDIEQTVETRVDEKIKDFMDVKLPLYIKEKGPGLIKKAMETAKPEIKKMMAEETPKMMKEQAPKIVETFLEDITKRINDPKEEELADVMCAMADSALAIFRVRMKDPVFNKEVNDFINGKMTGVAAQLETRLPGILVKAAPEIKKALLTDGGGGEGVGGLLGMLGIDLKALGVNLGQ